FPENALAGAEIFVPAGRHGNGHHGHGRHGNERHSTSELVFLGTGFTPAAESSHVPVLDFPGAVLTPANVIIPREKVSDHSEGASHARHGRVVSGDIAVIAEAQGIGTIRNDDGGSGGGCNPSVPCDPLPPPDDGY